MQNFPRSLTVLLVLAVSLTGTPFGVSLVKAAQDSSFDAQAYFKRLNRNGNKSLEVAELNPRARRFVQQLGFDPTDDIRLRDLLRRLENREKQAGQGTSNEAKTASGPVTAFGLPIDQQTVPSFGNQTTDAAKVEYSSATIEMTNSVLARYDKDRNGLIDSEEIKSGRWGRPEASESDLDRDGSLSRAELLNRYHQRSLERERQQNDRNPEDQNRDSRGRRDRGDRRRSNDDGSDRRDGGREAGNRQTTQRSPQQQREQYRSYAKGLIKRYDKDNDGRLSKNEWQAVKRKPTGADSNGDGFVDTEEYASALLEAANPKSTANSGRSKSPKTIGGKTLPADMAKKDANQDAQVQMHEYTTDWSEASLAKFYQLDTNGDGVITRSEWQRKSK